MYEDGMNRFFCLRYVSGEVIYLMLAVRSLGSWPALWLCLLLALMLLFCV